MHCYCTPLLFHNPHNQSYRPLISIILNLGFTEFVIDSLLVTGIPNYGKVRRHISQYCSIR